jgi:Flp pilus assembly protein TadD
LPLTAIVALIAAGFRTVCRVRSLQAIPLLLVLGWSALTMQRARLLASDEALWRNTLEKNPGAWTAHNNLGCILAARKEYDPAIEQFEAALKLNPRNAGAHVNLARALSLRGHFAEAESHFETALKIKPSDPEIHESYASALAEQGRQVQAIEHLRAAKRPRPEPGPALLLATLLYQTGQPAEAAVQYRRLLAFEPEQSEVLNNLAWLLATCADPSVRNGADAVQLAEQACRLTGYTNATSVGTLAAAYAEVGRFTNAVETATKAVNLATASGDLQFAGINQQLRKLYGAGVPYHETPK